MRLAILLALGLCAVTGATSAAAQTPAPALQGRQGGAHGAAHEACAADLARFCPGVQPGGGRIRQCFKGHFSELTDSCRSALMAARAARAAGGMQH